MFLKNSYSGIVRRIGILYSLVFSLICKYISKTIKTKERKLFLEQQMNRISQDASTKKSEEESVPMSVVEFLDAVEEPLKDQHLPEAKGKDSQDKRSFKVQFCNLSLDT